MKISEFQRGEGRNDTIQIVCGREEVLSAVFSRSDWLKSPGEAAAFSFEIDGDPLDANTQISSLDLELGDIIEVRKN